MPLLAYSLHYIVVVEIGTLQVAFNLNLRVGAMHMHSDFG